MKTQHPIRTMCEAFEVSTSGYYDWLSRSRQPGPRAQENLLLAAQIIEIHLASRQTYGSPRIQQALVKAGRCPSRLLKNSNFL